MKLLWFNYLFPALCSHFPNSFISLFITEQDALEAADFKQYSMRTRESLSCWNPDSMGFNLIENVLCHICREQRPGAVLVFMKYILICYELLIYKIVNIMKYTAETQLMVGNSLCKASVLQVYKFKELCLGANQ